MNKTLLILGTHFIDESVISEYEKMLNTPNVDAILAVNNNEYKCDFKNRIETKIFFGVSVHCFFFDSKLHEELELPYYVYMGEQNFKGVMWNNSDYRFYYIKKYFPNYDYYWLIEYDVFCNANTYARFLKKYNDKNVDLLIQRIRPEPKNGEFGTHGATWIYKDNDIYAGFFPVVRLSARAIDFLYKRRLEHKAIFQTNNSPKVWIFCETFVPTELMNNGFSCMDLNEPNLQWKNNGETIHLNDKRIFLKPDDCLYHPLKSSRKRYDDLFFMFRKVFLTSAVAQLTTTISADKKFSVFYDDKFNTALLRIPTGGGCLLSVTQSKCPKLNMQSMFLLLLRMLTKIFVSRKNFWD